MNNNTLLQDDYNSQIGVIITLLMELLANELLDENDNSTRQSKRRY